MQFQVMHPHQLFSENAWNIEIVAYYIVKKDSKWGIVDASTGELTCEPQFAGISLVSSKILVASFDGEKWDVIDVHGKVIGKMEYDEFADMHQFLYSGMTAKSRKIDANINRSAVPVDFTVTIETNTAGVLRPVADVLQKKYGWKLAPDYKAEAFDVGDWFRVEIKKGGTPVIYPPVVDFYDEEAE